MLASTKPFVSDRVRDVFRSAAFRLFVASTATLGSLLAFWLSGAVVHAQRGEAIDAASQHPPVAQAALELTNKEWRKFLTKEQFAILRRAGTEPAFANRYFDFKGHGTYACVACGNRLFSSDCKYDSGTGWPSFTKPLDDAVVAERPDNSHGMRRVEVVCTRCGGHLGHVFDDGPPPIGLRYCMNSAALTFFPDRHAERMRVSELHR